jgi:hypothetical protein
MSKKKATLKVRPVKLRPVEEREPVRVGLQLFRERMGWTQHDIAAKLGRSYQAAQKDEGCVVETVLSFCITEANRKGWHDLAFMLGAPGSRVEGEPTSAEQQTLNRVLLLHRRRKEFSGELEKLLAYFEGPVKQKR